MARPDYLVLDTLDDRREIHHLLKRLPPLERVAFLRWACAQATLPNSRTSPGVSARTVALAQVAERDSSADARLALECYFDLWMLASQYDFSLDKALTRLVEIVRRSPSSARLRSAPRPSASVPAPAFGAR